MKGKYTKMNQKFARFMRHTKSALHFIYSPIKLNGRRSWKPPCFCGGKSLFEKLICIILISPLICVTHTRLSYLPYQTNILIACRHEHLKY